MASGFEDEHIAKRQRTDDMSNGMQDDPHKPAPSQVVHVRGLSDMVTEGDIVSAIQHFGQVAYVIMMPRKRQALIEFEELNGARNCVNFSQNNQVYVRGQPAFFNYSTSSRIQRPGAGEDNRAANHILLFTILNPQYPITVDVMHTICSNYGQVQRIVIFKKNGVQAMVEFESIDSATRVKQSLNGADIYSGCCTLKIEYAKPTRLNVLRNDGDSWDYTNPNLGKDQGGPGALLKRSQPLLQPPRYGAGPQLYTRGEGPGGFSQERYNEAPMSDDMVDTGYNKGRWGGGNEPPRRGGAVGGYSGAPPSSSMYDHGDNFDSYSGPASPPYGMQQDRYGSGPGPKMGMSDRYGGGPPQQQQRYGDMGGMQQPGMGHQGAVAMVYGLNMEKTNCDKLFNLFCLYGNVVRVKFLRSKEGSAMVQMGDALAVERVIYNLNNCLFFNNKMQLGHSKQAFLQDVPNPHDLGDGTTSFKDFMGSRNNRFTNPDAASKNRITNVTKILHYFNAPPNITDEEISAIFTSNGATAPVQVKQFPPKSERSSTGLIEFDNKTEATEALILANHHSIPNPTPGKSPYVFKLCFSSTPLLG